VAHALPRPAVIALAGGLRDARTESGIKLRRLADLLDISAGLLSAWELGVRVPEATAVAHTLGFLQARKIVCDRLIDLARRAREQDLIAHNGREADLLHTTYEQRAEHVFEWSPTLVPDPLKAADFVPKTRYTFLIGDVATRSHAVAKYPRVSVRIVEAADCPNGLPESFILYEDNAGAFAVAVRLHRGAVFLTHEAALTTYQEIAQALQSRVIDNVRR
jgi:transcriptional regulator with XRE-family HTH domain